MKARAGALLEIGLTSEKVAASLVGPPSKLARDVYESPDLSRPEGLPLSYAIQTLRTQTVDFYDSREFIKRAAAYEAQQYASHYGKKGSMLDVTILQNTSKRNVEEQNNDVLILQVSGDHQNELVAIILSAPEYARDRSESAFSDYNLYRSPGKVTIGALRKDITQQDEQDAEARHRSKDGEDGPSDELLFESFIIHTFPTKICSVHFGPETTSYGRFHTGPWVCIRTLSSTIFASVGVSSRKERLQEYPRLRLVALLEISHGDSLLPSGVTQRKSRSGVYLSEQATCKCSRFPIVDVRYHPSRCTSAVTIDSKGNVGVFDCDMLTVKESSWDNGVTWSMKQEAGNEGGNLESHWMVEWAEEEEMVVVANRSVIEHLSLLDGTRRTIYSCTEGAIISVTRSSSPTSLLWVGTSKHILLYDLRSETSFQALFSWEHHCSHSSQLCLSSMETLSEASTVMLSNRCNRLLSLYSATQSSSASPATTIGEASQLNSGLPSKESYATAPVFVKLMDLHTLWLKWVRRSSPGKQRQLEGDQLMIEMGTDGSVWVRVVSWSINSSMLPSTDSNRDGQRRSFKTQDNSGLQSNLPEIMAERSLHSLGPVYRVLMGVTSADGMPNVEAHSTLMQASRWLQEQEVPLDTMLLPYDLLAFGHSDESSLHTCGSVLMQVPFLSMSMAVSPGVQRLLHQVLTSAQSDAWTMDLTQLIEKQLCTRIPTSDSIDGISEIMTRMYISQDQATRPLIAMERLASKIQDCCREIGWDLLLSSRVISMRPIVVQEARAEEGKGETTIPHQAPPFSFSFFTPRLAAPNETKSSLPSHHQHITTRKRIMTKSARWLLDEWQIGSDPKEYRFQHPYGNEDGNGAITGSEDYLSQSESEQPRSSRDQSRFSRSVSAAHLQPGQSDSPSSIPLPPTIGSASQPNFAAMPGHSSRRLIAQSQPVLASHRTARPKKRRLGGF